MEPRKGRYGNRLPHSILAVRMWDPQEKEITMKRREFISAGSSGLLGLGVLMFFGGSARAARISREADVQDKPGLSRVLLLGDSISMGVGSTGSYQGYEEPTRKLLNGKANVYGISGNGGNTQFGLQNLPKWLGEEHWDGNLFNWGLDYIWKGETAGGCNVPLVQYVRNLRGIFPKPKAN